MDEERDDKGRFVEGNEAALGHRRPHAARVAELRRELFQVLTRDHIRSVLEALLAEAEGGNIGAAKLLLAYALGEPVPEDIISRVEELEAET